MTTAMLPAPPDTLPVPAAVITDIGEDDLEDLAPAAGHPGYFLIPLTEFGQSLDSPGVDTWFDEFAQRNKDAAEYEITARGELRIMPPTGFPFDLYESEIAADAVIHARHHGGMAGGPTSRFILPDGARRGPDAWWLSAARWQSAPESARRPPFTAVVPDFIAEIVSPSNRGSELADKTRRYLQGGARLIWIINARRRQVTIYRPGREPEVLDDPELLHGEDVMPGFVFNVRQRIFDNIP